MQPKTATWVERSARLGYAAKGIVYITVGLLATLAAFNLGGETTSSSGALEAIARQPFGQLLLSIVAIGLAGYVLWRFIQAIQDPEHPNSQGAEAIFRRLGYGMNGLVYAGVAYTAVQILAKTQQSAQGDSTQLWTARLMAQPFGQWLVGTVGAFTIGFGFYYFYRAVKTKFRDKLKLHRMSPAEQTWAMRVGVLGMAARSIVFAIIGVFLIQAARQADPSEAKSSEGALQALQQNDPWGGLLLGLVALGLVAYGVHLLVQARYRRIDPT